MPEVLHAAIEAPVEADVLCPHDGDGHPQWLLAAYRREALGRSCDAVGTGHGVSVRRLVAGLRVLDAPEVAQHVGDGDTWAKHQAWQRRLTSEA